MPDSLPPQSDQSASPSIGARLHLLRLATHWSVEECAYRMTIEANAYVTPETWLSWERCADQEAAAQGLLAALSPLASLFAVDRHWLQHGEPSDQVVGPSSNVLSFPKRKVPPDPET